MSTERATYKDGICQRGDNVWLIKYYGGKDEKGKWKACYATVHGTRTEAKKKRRELMSHVDKGTHVDRSKTTVAEWIGSRLNVSEVSRKTLERYRELAKYVTDRLGAVHLQQLKAEHLEQLYKDLKQSGGRNGAPLSSTTVRHVHRLLSSALGDARRLDAIAANPLEKLNKKKLPKAAKSRAVIFEAAELDTLLSNLARDGDWLLPIVRLAVTTGMRRGELLALRWGAVDLDKRLIHVRESLEETRSVGVEFKTPKTEGSARSISISEAVAADIRAYWKDCAEAALKCGNRLADASLVFPASPAELEIPRKPRSVSEAFSDRLAKYGLKKEGLSLHSLRHTHASILISKGVNIKIVAARLGHAKASITLDIYAHLMSDDQAQAVRAVDQFFGAAVLGCVAV